MFVHLQTDFRLGLGEIEGRDRDTERKRDLETKRQRDG